MPAHIPNIPIKNYLLESQLTVNRAVAALSLVVLLTMVLVMRLVWLQVASFDHYRTLSRDNRVKVEPLPPTRGLVFDRKGRRLAENLPAYSLELTPELVPDMAATLAALGALVTISDSDVERFTKLVRRQPKFARVPLRFRLADDELARLAVNRHRLPGVDVVARLDRNYPFGALTAHALGYVGRISVDDLNRLDAGAYRGTSHIGKRGIERAYEAVLHGTTGVQQVEVNAEGRELRVLERQPPEKGEDLRLFLDVDVQRAARDALAGRKGAVVAIEIASGGVLALVSEPGYDPNLFVHGISSAAYAALTGDRDQPLFNRAIRGRYPPGSTIKPFLGLAGLDSGVITPRTKRICPGYFQLEGRKRKYRDWKRQGHGRTDLAKAIVESCDVYFYQLAVDLGIDRLHDFLDRFGLGRPTGIDIPGESGGLLPSRAWKRAARNEPWYPGETVIAGIGQGFMQITPLQLAAATAQLARGGQPLRPRLVQDGSAAVAEPVEPLNPRHLKSILTAMTNVVHGARGTARSIGLDAPYRIAGKTGTAQVFGLKQDEVYDAEAIAEHLRDHALFIGFAPADAPRIAVAVVVENGGSGGATAAPVARAVMDAYLLDAAEDG